jgi:hypothetical protein
MNQAHFHLMLNHFPIIGSMIGTVILAIGLLLKRTDMKRVGLALFIFIGILIIPVWISGEGAEKVLKANGYSDEGFIHQHEKFGEWLGRTCIIIGLLAVLGFYFELTQKKIARIFMIFILALSIANGYLLKLTGTSGGQIRHTEIRDKAEINQSSVNEIDASGKVED